MYFKILLIFTHEYVCITFPRDLDSYVFKRRFQYKIRCLYQLEVHSVSSKYFIFNISSKQA